MNNIIDKNIIINNNIKVIKKTFINGNNVWNYSNTYIILIDLGNFKNIFTDKIINLHYNLIKYIPTIYFHRCSIGINGGFLQRIEKGTLISHLLEHIIIELMNYTGYWKGIGKTREYYIDGQYNISILCHFLSEDIMEECLNCGLDIIDKLINNIFIDMSQYRLKIISKFNFYNMMKYNIVLFKQLIKYNVPFLCLNTYDYIQIGHGINQYRIVDNYYDNNKSIDNNIYENITKYIDVLYLNDSNVNVLKTYVVNNYNEYLDVKKKLKSSIILKPFDKYTNSGRVILDYKDDSINYYNYACKYNKDQTCKKIIIQNYIDSDMFCSVIVNFDIVCIYKIEYIDKNIELIGNGICTIIQLFDTYLSNNYLMNSNVNIKKVYIDNELYYDYDSLNYFMKIKNINKNHILNKNEKLNLIIKTYEPKNIDNIDENIKKKLLLFAKKINLSIVEIKFFYINDAINILKIKQKINLSFLDYINYIDAYFNKILDINKNYNIKSLIFIGRKNIDFCNSVISNFFISIDTYVISYIDKKYIIDGKNIDIISDNFDINNIIINKKLELFIFNIDTDIYFNNGIFMNKYNPIILDKIDITINDSHYLNDNYNSIELLNSIIHKKVIDKYIILNADDDLIDGLINNDQSYILYTKYNYIDANIYQSKKHDNLNYVFVFNDHICIKYNNVSKKILNIYNLKYNQYNIDDVLIIISSIWSYYDIIDDIKFNHLKEYLNKIFK